MSSPAPQKGHCLAHGEFPKDSPDTNCPSCEDDVPWEVVKIQLTEEETRFSREFLGRLSSDPKQSDIPLTKTAKFKTCPGLEADIKLCNGSSPYVDPVLFMDGNEVEALGADESLEGEYDFELDGKIYRVEILPAPLADYTDLGPEAALPWTKGLESNAEETQIISTPGWHVATIAISPNEQIADFLLKAANHHDELTRFLDWIVKQSILDITDIDTFAQVVQTKAKKLHKKLNETSCCGNCDGGCQSEDRIPCAGCDMPTIPDREGLAERERRPAQHPHLRPGVHLQQPIQTPNRKNP